MITDRYISRLVTETHELQQIAVLCNENLRTNLTEEEKRSEGFITWEYSFEQLEAMHRIAPAVIVKYGEQVAGYALTAIKETSAIQPELVPMIAHLETLHFQGKPVKEIPYYIMGQVCIARTHRGKGVFQMLYAQHKAMFRSQFDLLVTEISTSNYRSIQAHRRVGFETIDTYRDQLDEWAVVAWDWS